MIIYCFRNCTKEGTSLAVVCLVSVIDLHVYLDLDLFHPRCTLGKVLRLFNSGFSVKSKAIST